MANELVLSFSMEYLDSNDVAMSYAIDALRRSVSATRPIHYVQNVGFASEEALTLGESATYGYMIVRNLDATNFVQLRVATGGAAFCKLTPGDFCVVPLGTGAQAPYAIADTAACNLEVFIIPR